MLKFFLNSPAAGDSIQKISHWSHSYLFITFTHEVQITTVDHN